MKSTNDQNANRALVQASTYVLSGNLKGEIDPEFLENLPKGSKVRLYRSDEKTAPDLKLSTRILSAEELISFQRSFIAEGEIDEKGNYEIKMSNNQYQDGPVLMGVYLKTVPFKKPDNKSYDPILVLMGVLNPDWVVGNTQDNVATAKFSYIFSNRFWCLVRDYFNGWVICGQVCDTDTGAGVAGAQVRACDRDLIQDDNLGEVETNAGGYFRIDYATNDFRRTPIPGLLLENVPGPDVYFRVQFGEETPLDEARSVGYNPGRRDIGRCFYIKLAIDVIPNDNPGPDPTNTFFDQVGNYDIDDHFTVDGLGKLSPSDRERAFIGNVRLKGSLPDGNNGNAVKYRFTYQWMNPTTNIFSAAEPVTRNMISTTRIGSRVVTNPGPPLTFSQGPFNLNPSLSSAPVSSLIQAGETWMDNGGWVELPQSIPNMHFDAGEVLLILNTHVLTTIGDGLSGRSSNHDLGNHSAFAAGDDMPTINESPSHTFRITFQAEVNGSLLPEDVLEKIVVCNTNYTYERHPNWGGGVTNSTALVSLNIQQLMGAGACGDLVNDMTVRYSVYHPHLHNASFVLKGNPTAASVTLPAIPIAANGEGFASVPVDISSLSACAYLLELWVSLNLTSGENNAASIEDEMAFCKD